MLVPDYVFCGSFWPVCPMERYQAWAQYNHRLFPDSQLIIFHDGPDPRVAIPDNVRVVYLEPHLGRSGNLEHPGCWRSMFSMINFAEKAKKLVWMEWDFYVCTQKMLDWICELHDGWSTVFCKHFDFPECSLQVVCIDQFERLRWFGERWNCIPHTDEIEKHIPFTRINRKLKGDRYTDFGVVPDPDADFIAQCPLDVALKLMA